MTKLILKHLMNSDDNYASKVFPFLKHNYFDNEDEQYLFKVVQKYYEKYDNFPNFNEVSVLIEKNKDDEDRFRLQKILGKIKVENELEPNKFLLDETEEFIRNKDLMISIIDSVSYIQKEDKLLIAGIPSLIEGSLGISFDRTVGLNFNDSLEERIQYYKNRDTDGFKTDLKVLNDLTNGGFKKKTLTTIVGAPHSGKTCTMTHLATSFLLNKYNVLYITLEMSEHEIACRIDSNLLNIKMDDLQFTSTEDFVNTCKNVISNGIGNLIIKEYPTGGANAIHFKSLLKDLYQKQKFKPDIVLVDYLGIMSAVSDNMYDNIKKLAESLRSIAVEYQCAVFTGSQTNRAGFDRNNGIMMSDIAESTGPLQISDCVFGISKFDTGTEEEVTDQKQSFKRITEQNILVNVLKNRMGGLTRDKFLLKQNFNYMRLEEDVPTGGNYSNTSIGLENFTDKLNSKAKEAQTFNF